MWSPYLWIMLMTVCNAETGDCTHQALQGFVKQDMCYAAAEPISKAFAFVKQRDVQFTVTAECVAVERREA